MNPLLVRRTVLGFGGFSSATQPLRTFMDFMPSYREFRLIGSHLDAPVRRLVPAAAGQRTRISRIDFAEANPEV